MGAMVPPSHWIPDDDVLLKNAVEAGASLESLAKGAVQFSQRFTIQELQDRWCSLLYDPVVSEEASARMTELELSSFTNQSRPNKPDGAKEITCSSMKRKAASIRKSYYAMRKRICNEPFDMMDINILSGPGNSNFGDGNELSSADRVIGGNPFSEFPTGAVESTIGQNHDQDLHYGGMSQHLYGDNIPITGDHNEAPTFGPSKQLPLCNLFEAESLENEGNACLDFVGPSFDGFACTSSLPQMPIWSTSTQDQHTGDAFILPEAGDANEERALGYDGASLNPIMKTSMSCDSMSSLPPSTEEYFAELSNKLFDFTNDDELLFSDTNGKDIIDKSYLDGLSSLLLDSPNQSHEFPIAGLGEDAVTVADMQIIGASGAHIGGPDLGLHHCDQRKVPEAQVTSSASTMRCFGPEYRNGVICCTLNTEDPEIPSNDDVFLPFRFPSPTNSSGAHWKLHDSSYLVPSSVKEFSSTRKSNGGPPMMKNTQKDGCVPSNKIMSSLPLDSGSKYPTGDRGVKFELPKSNIQHAALRNARSGECPNRIGSSNNWSAGVVIGGAMEMERGKDIDKHGPGQNIPQSLQRSATAETPNNGSSNVELTIQNTVVEKPIDKALLSDQEELWSENDFDVPYFSDVEAMILDMDLSPDEFDLYTNPEVQRYQHEETKRTIIRLEQAANSCMQRAIAAQGALAVLYGRCSKHFIKKSEVLLGRATEDVEVDIDLGSEKNGGKISRKQAIIKMDMHGTFHLRNVGKSSVYVNDREVATGQSLSLTSGCLIEVRGLAFVFETNHARVQQHVHSIMSGGVFLDQKPLT
ncbi:hypothetical protein BUALT_Bualt08G0078200 [Buddleja alternifolia]|uniref:FHA domain-containing protein n=1 Tax=Buddleja alternifolia TaxID=168488 RepID=A0AAV6X5T5_9LAMI|nr:hypothetical protein BUALT_Bualt08G0078200 [Buddleja alternifolia]